jgi:acylpyruvate hydrolase
MGKSFDGFAPMGPALVTADEIPDPQNLDLRVTIGDDVLQRSNTRNMIFSVARIIAYITEAITLEPGDVIATGTPEGVGAARTPQRFLKAGETVRVAIERLGALENPVVAERRGEG